MLKKVWSCLLALLLGLSFGQLTMASESEYTTIAQFTNGWEIEGVLCTLYPDTELPILYDLLDMGDLSDMYGVIPALERSSFYRIGEVPAYAFEEMTPKSTITLLLKHPQANDEDNYVGDLSRSVTISSFEDSPDLLITSPSLMKALNGRGYLTEVYAADKNLYTFVRDLSERLSET